MDAGTRVEPGNLYDLMVDAKDTVDSLRIEPWTRDDDKLIKRILSFGKESSTEDEVDFLQKEGIFNVLDKINNESKTYRQFELQFHKWFDNLKTLRLLKFYS